MIDGGTVGSITKSDLFCFSWTIPNFRSLPANVGHFFCSPDIYHLDNVWNLCIYPCGTDSSPLSTMLQLWRKNVSAVQSVRFSLHTCFKFFAGQENIINNQRFDSDNCFSSGLFLFMNRDILLSRLQVHSDDLYIMLTIWIDEPTLPKDSSAESESEDLSSSDSEEEDCVQNDLKGDDPTLRKHLEDMLLAGDSHDVTIKVKHQQFRAHKCMLQARSPVFAAMFKQKMKESTDDSISIDDCDPESFGDFLFYIYTGKVKNLSLSKAMGLYYAGDKYDFSGLKEMCLEFLKTSLSTAAIGDVITLAIKHSEDELLECAMAFVAKHLEEMLGSVEWQRLVLDNPLQANEICLKAMKCRLHEK